MPDGRYSHTSCLLRAWLYPAICFHNLHTSKSGCRPCINKGDCSIALLHFADGCSKTGSPISSTPLTALTPMLSPRDATMLLKLSNVLPLAFVISPTSVLAFYRLRILRTPAVDKEPKPQLPKQHKEKPLNRYGSRVSLLVEHRRFELLTPTLPVLCATNCANAPHSTLDILSHLFPFVKS